MKYRIFVSVSYLVLILQSFGSTYLFGQDPCSKSLFTWNNGLAPQGGSPPLDEPLASDRPDFTEASSTVGKGIRQLEMGYTYFDDDTDGQKLRSHSYPEFLYRQGVWQDWLELRVGWSYNSETRTLSGISGTSHSTDGLYLGTKLALTLQQGYLPEMAIVPQMTVPLGGEFSPDHVLPGINWLYGWDVTDFLSLGASTQYNLSPDELTSRLHGQLAQSITLGQSWTEKIGSYTEWFMFSPVGAETEVAEYYIDGGVIYRWSNNMQSDVRVGMGLSDSATDFFSGIGHVVRF
jgi:hypothetical protein